MVHVEISFGQQKTFKNSLTLRNAVKSTQMLASLGDKLPKAHTFQHYELYAVFINTENRFGCDELT